jgi:hypothetical protein
MPLVHLYQLEGKRQVPWTRTKFCQNAHWRLIFCVKVVFQIAQVRILGASSLAILIRVFYSYISA